VRHPARRYWWVWWAVGGVMVAPCLLCPLGVIFHAELLHFSNHKPFNPEAWKAADASTRYDLSWDLIHGDVLTGKSQAEVLDLLGEPSIKQEFQLGELPLHGDGPAPPGSANWYYDLGSEKYEFQLGPSGAVLIVRFESGVVTQVRRHVH
jgi:hypothetical protein